MRLIPDTLRNETWFFLVSFLILAAQFAVFRIYEPDGVYSLHSRIFLSVADFRGV